MTKFRWTKFGKRVPRTQTFHKAVWEATWAISRDICIMRSSWTFINHQRCPDGFRNRPATKQSSKQMDNRTQTDTWIFLTFPIKIPNFRVHCSRVYPQIDIPDVTTDNPPPPQLLQLRYSSCRNSFIMFMSVTGTTPHQVHRVSLSTWAFAFFFTHYGHGSFSLSCPLFLQTRCSRM